jgi:DNA-damage-inducible protein J
MTTINIRIDENIKNKAIKTFASMGLDLSSAVKIFLNQAVREDGFPFHPTNNPKAIRAMWDKEVENALKKGKAYTSTKKMFDDIITGK